MAGTTKTLTFSEGVTVNAPTQSFLSASTFQSYASDAAYVAAKGEAATDGDCYYNTTLDLVRYYSNGAWSSFVDEDSVQEVVNKSIVDANNTFEDDVDPTKQMQFQLSGITTGNLRTMTIPDVDITIAGRANTETLTNKTLTSPVLTTPTTRNPTFQDPSDNSKQVNLDLTGVTTATTRTLTIPDASITLAGRNNTETLTNKTLTSPVLTTPTTRNPTFQDPTDNTKQMNLDLTGVTTGNTRTLTIPDTSITIAGRNNTETLTNKTLTSPVLTTPTTRNPTFQDPTDNTKQMNLDLTGVTTATTRTLTVPNASITIAGRDNTETLTNKTMTSPVLNSVDINAGTIDGTDINLGTASNSSKLVVSKNVRTTLDGLTREQGSLYYDTTSNVLTYDDGSSLINLGSGGELIFEARDSSGQSVSTSRTVVTFNNVITNDSTMYSSGTFTFLQAGFVIGGGCLRTQGINLSATQSFDGEIWLDTGGGFANNRRLFRSKGNANSVSHSGEMCFGISVSAGHKIQLQMSADVAGNLQADATSNHFFLRLI